MAINESVMHSDCKDPKSRCRYSGNQKPRKNGHFCVEKLLIRS